MEVPSWSSSSSSLSPPIQAEVDVVAVLLLAAPRPLDTPSLSRCPSHPSLLVAVPDFAAPDSVAPRPGCAS